MNQTNRLIVETIQPRKNAAMYLISLGILQLFQTVLVGHLAMDDGG